MSEQTYKKAIFICRIVAVLSAVMLIILITVLTASTGADIPWTDGTSEYILWGVVYMLSAGVFLPPFVILGVRMKMQSQNTDDRIRKLEQEVERLKNK